MYFDVSQEWAILIPADVPAAQRAGADLARIIGLLRGRAGLHPKIPPLINGSREAPAESIPVIVLNALRRENQNGYSWRLGKGRLEIYGDSGRGLCNGVYGFLAALGLEWPRPDQENLPPTAGSPAGGAALTAAAPAMADSTPAARPENPAAYPLKMAGDHQASERDPAKKRRLVIGREFPLKGREQALLWAVRNRIDALVLPLAEPLTGKGRRVRERLRALGEPYGLDLEYGGWDLSALLPRRYFLTRKELFRMEEGRRVRQHHFCPTNPDSMGIIKKEAGRLFREHPEAAIFHLWPDRGHEQTWCSCPTCRAFSREEQNRIAVNIAADVLAELQPGAKVSYYKNSDETGDIPPRPNMFPLARLPQESAGGGEGLFLLC
jgi:hypothetical protein